MSHRDIEHSCNQVPDQSTQRALKDVAFKDEKYFGDPNKNGCWCQAVETSSGDLVTYKLVSGTWVVKQRLS